MHRTAKLSTCVDILSPLHNLFTYLYMFLQNLLFSFSPPLSLPLFLHPSPLPLTIPLCLLFLLLFLNSLSSSALKEFSSIFLLSLCLKSGVQTLEKLEPKFEYNPGSRTCISLSLSLSSFFSKLLSG